MNYYNEFDQFAAAWLRELIKDGLIPQGEVDERSITEVESGDLKGFTQCHFFAGIGGWSLALELAGWGADRPVWTGSPPCQPFSVAGNKKGKDDIRHLWPVFFNLIRECSPTAIFGEQVASAIRHGWFDDLQTDLEAEGYASAMAVLPACSVNAPHKRDRLFYVAKRLGDTNRERHNWEYPRIRENEPRWNATKNIETSWASDSSRCERVGDTEHNGSHGVEVGRSAAETGNNHPQRSDVPCESAGAGRPEESGNIRHWDDTQFVYCRDGKYRQIPTEPALFPLANGISNRVGLLRGAGNAIVPQVAAEVIKAVM